MKYSFIDELLYSHRILLTGADRRLLNKISANVVRGSKREVDGKIVVDLKNGGNFIIELDKDNTIKSMAMDPGHMDNYVKVKKTKSGFSAIFGYIISQDEVIVFNGRSMNYYSGRDICSYIPPQTRNPEMYLEQCGIAPDVTRIIERPNSILEYMTLHSFEDSRLYLREYINQANKRTITRKV